MPRAPRARRASQPPASALPSPPPPRASLPDADAPLLGAHISTAGGFGMAVTRAVSIGCTAAQIFVKNNMQWSAPPLSSAEAEELLHHPDRPRLRALFGHTGYLVNIAAAGPNRARSIASLALELERAERLGLPFLVLHPGAHLGAGVDKGIELAARALDEVFAALPGAACRVALETTAGQGTCLGHELSHLARIRSLVSDPGRVCFCADTAHLWAAGYDLSTAEAARRVFDEIRQTLGPDLLAAIHLNDSKTPLGSRVDRHEHIGKGRIGTAAFAWIMREPSLAAIPKVLETPKGPSMAEDVQNLAVLRALAAGGPLPERD